MKRQLSRVAVGSLLVTGCSLGDPPHLLGNDSGTKSLPDASSGATGSSDGGTPGTAARLPAALARRAARAG
jgi:hypothetical protein